MNDFANIAQAAIVISCELALEPDGVVLERWMEEARMRHKIKVGPWDAAVEYMITRRHLIIVQADNGVFWARLH